MASGGLQPITALFFAQASGGLQPLIALFFAQASGGLQPMIVLFFAQASGGLQPIIALFFAQASGGPHGAVGVDSEFERLLERIFGRDFVEIYRTKRSAGYVDLMSAFEAKKRTANPTKVSLAQREWDTLVDKGQRNAMC